MQQQLVLSSSSSRSIHLFFFFGCFLFEHLRTLGLFCDAGRLLLSSWWIFGWFISVAKGADTGPVITSHGPPPRYHRIPNLSNLFLFVFSPLFIVGFVQNTTNQLVFSINHHRSEWGSSWGGTCVFCSPSPITWKCCD
jgi:hypothetical protein